MILVLGLAATARADGPKPRPLQVELGLFGGVFLANKNHEFYDADAQTQEALAKIAFDVGARLGFYPLPFLGLEGEFGFIPTKTRDTGRSVNLLSYRGQVVLQLPARVTPFILGGFGTFLTRSDFLGDDSDNDWHVGAGLKFFATDRFQIRADGRIYRGNRLRDAGDDNGEVSHWNATASLAWVFGGVKPAAGPQDRDGDGVLDKEDQCPDTAGVPPTGCPPADKDGDGLSDDIDKCPDQAETVNGHEDTDGCPDEVPDTDGDGIRGDADKCPDQPEDVDGFEDEDGCPEPDNDKDSLLDAADGCPSEAGPAENRGCPDKDRDGDTVVDRLDNCPDEAGTPDNQGCKDKQLVVITQTQLKILDRVNFKTNKAIIDKKSHRLLNNIATVLTAHPEIKRIRVEGHTDSQGSDAKNKNLSQKRAEAVALYLTKQGIAPERLDPVGFGEERPIADNLTKDGRAENRRVEFNIIDPAPAPEGAAPTPAPEPAPTK